VKRGEEKHGHWRGKKKPEKSGEKKRKKIHWKTKGQSTVELGGRKASSRARARKEKKKGKSHVRVEKENPVMGGGERKRKRTPVLGRKKILKGKNPEKGRKRTASGRREVGRGKKGE